MKHLGAAVIERNEVVLGENPSVTRSKNLWPGAVCRGGISGTG